MNDMFESAPTDPSKVIAAAPADRWPTILAEFVQVLVSVYRNRGMAELDALEAAQQGVCALGNHLGGRNIYLPTGERLAAAVRDRVIYLQYNGRNKALLADRFNLTERRIEQIAVEQRAIHVRKLQGRLFDD